MKEKIPTGLDRQEAFDAIMERKSADTIDKADLTAVLNAFGRIAKELKAEREKNETKSD